MCVALFCYHPFKNCIVCPLWTTDSINQSINNHLIEGIRSWQETQLRLQKINRSIQEETVPPDSIHMMIVNQGLDSFRWYVLFWEIRITCVMEVSLYEVWDFIMLIRCGCLFTGHEWDNVCPFERFLVRQTWWSRIFAECLTGQQISQVSSLSIVNFISFVPTYYRCFNTGI